MNSKPGPEANLKTDHALLLSWYRDHRRDLPWRKSRDPYRIWISEIMLQQTTVAAVIPYFERFLKAFPTVHDLAAAPESEVLKNWAGLGYYSRARNLHKSAQHLAQHGFPKTAAELIELPGFGPYTAAAVASIAFGDPVGVLDGNVIRVLSRKAGIDGPWWTTSVRRELQSLSDQLAQLGSPDEINQGLMELGATVCTPQSPACLLCPWTRRCVARKSDRIKVLPRPKPRKKMEIWSWTPRVYFRRDQVALVPQTEGPVLKGQWVFPGEFKKLQKKPAKFHTRHGITHHDLYVTVTKAKGTPSGKDIRWVPVEQLSEVNPSKLLQKILDTLRDPS